MGSGPQGGHFIFLNLPVVSDEDQVFNLRLRNQHPVKRVPMQKRQLPARWVCAISIFSGSSSLLLSSASGSAGNGRSLPIPILMLISQKLAKLTND